MERAYSTLTITKAVAAERTVEGIASVPAVDRQGDIVESRGVRWRKDANGRPDVPWLYQHRHDSPIGRVEWLQAKPDGLRFKARMPKIDEPGPLKDRLDTAFQEIAAGLVRGISIGFMPLKAEPIDTGWRFKEISLYEISSVTIPACEEACVEVVKRYDEAARRGEPIDSTAKPSGLWDLCKLAGREGLDRAEHEWKEAFQKMLPAERKHAAELCQMQFLQGSIHEMLKFLAGRIEATEQQGPAYKGIWKPGTYPAGCFVTHGGSMFHADKATDFKPGEGGGWTLAVKRGADAKERG